MILVKATSEGLMGKTTYSGYVISDHNAFVALPSRLAQHWWIRITNPLLPDLYCYAEVLDVGPWNGGIWKSPAGDVVNTDDDQYVLSGGRPQAESGKDLRGRTTNKAGIDLGPYCWRVLGMKDNTEVQWERVQ